jgi:hypothetical protein
VPFSRELGYRSAGQKRFVVRMCVQANDRGHKAIVAGSKRRAIQDANNEPWRYLSQEYAKEGQR